MKFFIRAFFKTLRAVLGPILLGMEHCVQIAPLSASVSQILNAAVFAAYEEGAMASEG